MVWLNSKLIKLRSAVTNCKLEGLPVRASAKALHVTSNKYLLNCLVLVQPDFEINEVLDSIIIVHVRCGGWGEGFTIEWGCLVILGSHEC